MKEHSSKLLAKSLDTLEAAEGLQNMGKTEVAAGRAYFDTRISGDYDVDADISTEIASELINQAREFLQTAQKYLKEKEQK